MTYNDYSASNDGGGSWFTPGVKHALEIRVSVAASTPEPGMLVFLALGGTLVLIKQWRRVSECREEQHPRRS